MTTDTPCPTPPATHAESPGTAARTSMTLSAAVALAATVMAVATVYLVFSRPLDLADALVEPDWPQILGAIAGLVAVGVARLVQTITWSGHAWNLLLINRRPAAPVADLVAAARPPGSHRERLVVRDGTRVHVIPVERLDDAQAQDDHVALRTEGQTLLKEQTLAELERALDPTRFVRVHRSFLVNLERLVRVEPCGRDSRVAILTDGTRLPVSRAGFARLGQLL